MLQYMQQEKKINIYNVESYYTSIQKTQNPVEEEGEGMNEIL